MEIPDVQPMQTDPLEFSDFSGGITDFYIGGDLKRYKTADNFVIQKYGTVGKLFTRPGSELYDTDHPQIPAGAQRIGTLKYFNSTLFTHSARKLYYTASGFQTLQGPSGNDLFPSGVDTTTVTSVSVWNKIMFIGNTDFSPVSKIYKDSGGTWRLRTAGLPALATSPTVTAGAAGAESYLYRFIRKYTYTVGTITYIDRGPSVEVFLDNTAAPNATPVAISAIAVLANSTTYNYDTVSASLVTEIYRTTSGGQNFFYVGQVVNGTTTYSDSTSDTTLQDNEPLYTEGGFPENDPPPLSRYIHTVGPLTFYAHVKIGSEIFSNRVYQSIPDDPDSVPATFFTDVDGDVGGISSTQSIPLVFCTEGPIYRLDGGFDELGNGFLAQQVISQTAGIVSNNSIVQTLEGVFWAGLDGFYFSDGYRALKISGSLRARYEAIVASAERKRRIIGKFEAQENRIHWTVQSAGGATDCDAVFILDLNWGISDEMPFTTSSGGASFSPTAVEFIGTNLLRADKRGYTFIHRDTLYTDPRIDTGTAVANWYTQTIMFDHVSIATDFGTTLYRKWVPACTVTCKNETNLSLQINSINDDGRRTGVLKPIRFRGNITWGDPDVYWGDPDILWNYQGLIDERRRMPAGGLRCEYKQLQLTNAKVVIITSDLIGTCTVNAAAHTATLTNSADFDWPSGAVDYFIAFEVDGYVKEYLVTARTANVLTFSDTDGIAQSRTLSGWVLRGYPKGEILQLLSYTMEYATFGKTQNTFRNSTTGEPGAAGS